MATTGYSGTPLLKKLGIKEAMKLWLLHAPDNYNQLLEADLSHQLVGKKELPDLIHLFVTSKKQFETEMRSLKTVFQSNPSVITWVSWYKKSAGIPTDLTEDVIRAYALQHDLVDIKVCAVSDQWSGLKLVVPKAKR
ncbi:hypothetical protein [Paraflavitalea sp. CAU 1676]|uniref:hypothetical protein n=1 Tax=Paraflavitalea sp. CAU 1676 TaxID=3032598 RepID=UPI0023DAA285|nr:hypothetical protein [Paraflavitalea sp. CAU 1676]MDF2187631.1 hypothetical protein [Paraflavitalea sp. CAU 1676]